jgi:hypothetical protein
MSTTYEYQRNYSDGKYDLENEFLEGEDEILPSDTIVAAFPGKKFKLFGEETVLKCVFEESLTAPEKTQLDTIISNDRKVI